MRNGLHPLFRSVLRSTTSAQTLSNSQRFGNAFLFQNFDSPSKFVCFVFSTVCLLLLLIPTQMAFGLQAMSEDELSEVTGQGFNFTHHEVSGDQMSGCSHCDSSNNTWEYYRMDLDAIIKIGATIDRLRLGRYDYDNNGSLGNGNGANNDGQGEFDVDLQDLVLGYYEPTDHCGAGKRTCSVRDMNKPNDPLVLVNPYIEFVFAPDTEFGRMNPKEGIDENLAAIDQGGVDQVNCELKGQNGCTASPPLTGEKVFMGWRLGFKEVTGPLGMQVNKVSGFMQAGLAAETVSLFGIPVTLDNVVGAGKRFNHLSDLSGSGLLGILGNLINLQDFLPLTDALYGLEAKKATGLWISQTRQTMKWPDQIGGAAAHAEDYERQGWNFHVSSPLVGGNDFEQGLRAHGILSILGIQIHM